VVVGGGGLVRAARRVVVEMEIAWGVLGKMLSISSGFYASRRGELFLLKGKSHGHGRVGTTT